MRPGAPLSPAAVWHRLQLVSQRAAIIFRVRPWNATSAVNGRWRAPVYFQVADTPSAENRDQRPVT